MLVLISKLLKYSLGKALNLFHPIPFFILCVQCLQELPIAPPHENKAVKKVTPAIFGFPTIHNSNKPTIPNTNKTSSDDVTLAITKHPMKPVNMLL
ncbi:hypothetical protein SNE40_015354 [Patella caerulea]|uniref:Uncharacterized protein n=1 Tax=Patella caerulea TaxID=87958 RepID=A0AAN8PKQ1_PATCE